MATTSDIRKGLCINYNNDTYKIIEFLHVKPGKGPAFVRTKLKSLTNGKVIDNTFSAGHKIDVVRVETNKFQYLYNDADKYFFMNADSYEQIELTKDQLNEKELLLKPNQEVTLSIYMDKPIDMQLPATINLLVTQSEPAVKGDSVNSNNKEVTCETGLTIQVPMFIEEKDVIKIDTKTISYVTRV